MAKRHKPMSDAELLAFLDGYVSQAVGNEDGELAQERQEVLQYYKGDRPLHTKRGSSRYVSTDTYDAVEAMHAQLLETFSAGHKLVRFAPQGAEDTSTADAITEYVAYVIHRQNPGYALFSDTIKDGLMYRQGVVKIWWQQEEETVEEEITQPMSGASLGQLLMADPEIEPDVEEVAPDLYMGTLRKTTMGGQVKIAVVPPHEFLMATKARNLETCPFIAHRTLKGRSDLIGLGLDPKEVDEVMAKGEDYDEAFEGIEDAERFKGMDDGIVSGLNEKWRRVWLHECYVRLDLDGTGDALWMIQKVQDKLLHKEKVQRHPFVIFTPIRLPHSLLGNNFAARIVPSQNSKTALMRAILDHTAVTINPRFLVKNGALAKPSELMDNRLGGIVNVSDPASSVLPLIPPPLNPYVFQSLQLLDQDLEDTSGISRLSQGLNKDAVSKQNSAALVEQLTTNSQTRQKVIARNFATTFLVPLYQLVADLVVENEQSEKIVEVAGQWTPVDPKAWGERRDVVAEVHLGYGEQDKECEKWLLLHQLMASDPMIGSLYGYDKRFNLYRKVFELKGVKDIATYLPPPAVAQPQPDPASQAQMQMAMEELNLKKRQQALEEAKFQFEQQKFMHEAGMAKVELQKDTVEFQAEHALEVRKQLHDEKIDNAEVQIMQQSADSDSLTAIASPNS
jgi:hypothetical protein